jgi:hypothetical protein
MLYHVAIAAVGIAGLFAMWTAVQNLKRRSDPRFGKGDDVMAGCGSCAMEDLCHAAADGPPAECPETRATGNHGKE